MANLGVTGIVRITRDCEVRKTSNGTFFGFGICSYRKNVKEGKQAVDFFDCDLYQKEPVPGLERRLVKGKLIYIENGQLKNDQYMLDGKERSKVRIYISSFEILNDNMVSGASVPEPPKYSSSSGPSEPVVASKAKVVSVHPSDLPPPLKQQGSSYKTETPVSIPDFQDNDDEPPF